MICPEGILAGGAYKVAEESAEGKMPLFPAWSRTHGMPGDWASPKRILQA